ncbi:hypothetical protein HYC85_000068 [Camellia sinensis]|uniref:Uncharacterized protein n=1 Tax=Camellia sinensis TaxID=4442 RepID=A0A7J7FPW1_CAMSI|nr:hypothetical protein HYC85_000068 [Camellia sinensis]
MEKLLPPEAEVEPWRLGLALFHHPPKVLKTFMYIHTYMDTHTRIHLSVYGLISNGL